MRTATTTHRPTRHALHAVALVAALAAPLQAAPTSTEIVLLHTGDLHGQVLPFDDLRTKSADLAPVGGLEALAHTLALERTHATQAGRQILYVDAGDFWQGTPESDRSQGALLTAWLKEVGAAAVTLGDHDFDAGAERTRHVLRAPGFAVLCANLFDLETGAPPPFCRSHLDVVLGDTRLTLIGVLDDQAKTLSAPRALQGLDLRDAFRTARAEVRAARRRGAQVVVVLSHGEADQHRAIASGIAGIDAVIGAHAGQRLHEVDLRHGTLIHATSGRGKEVGRILLTVRGGRVTTRRADIVSVSANPAPRHPATRRLLATLAGETTAKLDAVIGRAARTLRRTRGFEMSALGCWTADVMRAHTKTDLAITNKAGLRADLAKGPVRARDLYAISPFQNDLVTLRLTGRELRAELEHALSDTRFAVCISGMRVTYDRERPPGRRIVQVEVAGEATRDDRLYSVTTNSFLGKGGHGHRWLATRREWRRLPVELLQLQIDDLRRRKVLDPRAEPRIAAVRSTMPVVGE